MLPSFSSKTQLDRVSTQPELRFQRRPWQHREFLRLAHEIHEIGGLAHMTYGKSPRDDFVLATLQMPSAWAAVR